MAPSSVIFMCNRCRIGPCTVVLQYTSREMGTAYYKLSILYHVVVLNWLQDHSYLWISYSVTAFPDFVWSFVTPQNINDRFAYRFPTKQCRRPGELSGDLNLMYWIRKLESRRSGSSGFTGQHESISTLLPSIPRRRVRSMSQILNVWCRLFNEQDVSACTLNTTCLPSS